MSRIQAAYNALGREVLESEKPAVAAFKAKYGGGAGAKKTMRSSLSVKALGSTGYMVVSVKPLATCGAGPERISYLLHTADRAVSVKGDVMTAPRPTGPTVYVGVVTRKKVTDARPERPAEPKGKWNTQ